MADPVVAASSPLELLSLRAYARSRKERGLPGGTLRAIQKAIETGRITTVAGKIDPVRADAEWLNQDPDYAIRENMAGAAREATAATAPDGPIPEKGPLTRLNDLHRKHLAAKTATAEVQAEMKKLDLRKRAGELVEARQVERAQAELAKTWQTAVLNFGSELAQKLSFTLGVELDSLDAYVKVLFKEFLAERSRNFENAA